MYSTSPSAVKWFAGITTVEETKSLYRSLAFRYHPDRGGDLPTMQEINAQYDAHLQALSGTTVIGTDGQSHTYHYQAAREGAIMAVIDALLRLRMPDVDILLIGVYVWVLGATRAHRLELRALGLLWHDKRQCWYWKPADLPRAFYSSRDLGALAAVYGYRDFTALDPLTTV